MVHRVSIAELAAAGFVLHAAEAAAIVVDVCRQYERGAIRGIPSTHVIRLTPDGAVVAEGPITTDQPPVAKAAQLLNDLLPPFDAPPAFRVPGGLRLVVARALGTLDLPPFASIDEFCMAVSRFAAADLVSTSRNLYRAWEISRTPRMLTISDLRRARRATGLSLEDISAASGVSAALLRELEWGYLRNWRNDSVARTWLSGYAKASGLDEQLVSSIVGPMLEEQATSVVAREVPEPVALVASGPQNLVPAAVPQEAARKGWSPFWALVGAASVAVLAFVGVIEWTRPAVQARIETTAPAFVPEPVAPRPVVEDVVPAVQTHRHPAQKPAVTRAHTSARRPPAPPRKPVKQNFFKRQLLRIVIK